MTVLNFIGQAYENRSIPINCQKCINLYPEIESPDARTPISLQSVSGTKLFLDFFGGQINGMHYNTKLELIFIVANREVFTVSETGVSSSKGILPGDGLVAIADNGSQVGFALGDDYWVYDEPSDTLAQVKTIGGDIIQASDITYQDGYFLLPITDTQKYFITGFTAGVPDATLVDDLDFAEADASPDDIIGSLAVNGRVWFWGPNSYDTYYNSGAGLFPFTQIDSGNSQGYGLAGTFGKVLQDSMAYWASSDGRIYRSTGGLPQRISHHGIENSLRKYSTLTDVEASQWTENGHRFVAFSFPSGDQTWVFDATSQMWHERGTYSAETLPDNVKIWDSRFIQFAWNNRHIVGSRNRAKIGELDLELFTEYGETMKALRTSSIIHANQSSIFTTRLEMLMEVGRTEQATEPKILLSWSDDGGVTYKNKVQGTLGKIGEYMHRIVWYKLGKSVNRVYKLEITDNVRRNIIEVDAEIGAGWT